MALQMPGMPAEGLDVPTEAQWPVVNRTAGAARPSETVVLHGEARHSHSRSEVIRNRVACSDNGSFVDTSGGDEQVVELSKLTSGDREMLAKGVQAHEVLDQQDFVAELQDRLDRRETSRLTAVFCIRTGSSL